MNALLFTPVAIRAATLVLLGLVTAGISQHANAWGELGHQTIGEIAEEILRERNPEILRAMHGVVGIEPLYISATWPDDVRDDERFDDFKPFHFVDIPADPSKPADRTAMGVLTNYPALLLNRRAPREAKMIAHRYLVHVLGDIHQPLHTGHEVDRGGNSCAVKWQLADTDKPTITNLHSAWDTKVVEHIADRVKKQTSAKGWFGFKQVTKALMAKHRRLVDQAVEVDVHAWIADSRQAVKTIIYPDRLTHEQRVYCNKEASDLKDSEIPRLDAAFVAGIEEEVQKRLVLAGARLAATLTQIYGKANPVHSVDEKRILELLKVTGQESHPHSHGHDHK